MTAYKGSTEIKDIYKGSGQIKTVYKGNTIVYGYESTDVLFESSTAGTTSLIVKYPCTVQIIVVGGGSGGSASADQPKYAYKAREAAGASGGYVNAIYKLSPGTYSCTVGAAGNGTGIAQTAYGGWSGAGGTSSFSNLITCTGGGASWTQYNSGNTLGNGGTATATGYITLTAALTGNKGGGGEGYTTVYGGASHYGTYGKGGDASVANTTAYGYKGNSGYIKITVM